MTFGGTQGFMRKPSTPWYDDDNNFAGIVHQERNVTYALFQGTGHEVPAHAPEAVRPIRLLSLFYKLFLSIIITV